MRGRTKLQAPLLGQELGFEVNACILAAHVVLRKDLLRRSVPLERLADGDKVLCRGLPGQSYLLSSSGAIQASRHPGRSFNSRAKSKSAEQRQGWAYGC